jgi:CMP-N-acetylneuraminic acid synthetase
MNDIIEYEVERNEADLFIQTHCTNPLLQSTTISKAIDKFMSSEDADSLFTVTKQQKMLYDEDLEPINHDPYKLSRTQDLPPIYEDNSNLFVFTEETIENIGSRIGEDPMIYEMDEIESIDIDTKTDFQMAEYFHDKQ